MGMSITEASQTFTLLTVGDGLVSQIPALMISTATGIIVTRAASTGNLSEDITQQLFAFPVMLYVTGGTIAALGLITPINDVITMPIAILLGNKGGFTRYEMRRKIYNYRHCCYVTSRLRRRLIA